MVTSFHGKLLNINIPNAHFPTESPSTFSYINFLVTIHGFHDIKAKAWQHCNRDTCVKVVSEIICLSFDKE